jgi:RND family efflux transporter MFP subunit
VIRTKLVPLLAAALLLHTTLPLAAEYPAALDWSGRVSLTLSVSGVLDQVHARAGQVVKKGELLASLEPTLFKAAVAESRADLDRLNEEHADAKRDMDRVQELYARTVSATTELDAAKLRFARAQSGLAAVQARLERARRLLAESELHAPFDALILVRQGEPGLVITSQCQPAAVFSVARADELIARALADANQAGAVRIGGEAEVRVAGKILTGKVSGLAVQADGRYGIEVAIPRQGGLLAGQQATVRLP